MTYSPGLPGPGGAEPPRMVTAAPGPESRAWLERFRRAAAPMGPRPSAEPSETRSEPGAGAAGTIVYREGAGANVVDVDGNRYVDLAAGFGSLLLGHRPPRVIEALRQQAEQLCQSLGDLHPSDCKVRLLERLGARLMSGTAQVILAQSGADAVSAALKTAALYTGKPGVVAFGAAYHGLSYGPLALCGLRPSYRQPFAAQLNPCVRFLDYPADAAAAPAVLKEVHAELARGDVGAVVYEPILGRGGCVVPPPQFGQGLASACRQHGALLVADEIWTGLGRSGEWLFSAAQGADADIVCLGKGLGGVLPLSACAARTEVMAAWSRKDEVVHTATFAGAPLACATALATLEEVEDRELVARARSVGAALMRELEQLLARRAPSGAVRGAGLMLAVEAGVKPGASLELQRRLLSRGYIVSLGGGRRDSVVLTPPLDVSETLLGGFVEALSDTLGEVAP